MTFLIVLSIVNNNFLVYGFVHQQNTLLLHQGEINPDEG